MFMFHSLTLVLSVSILNQTRFRLNLSIVLNGQRFFRQGSRTPPEFRNNGTTGADTRANGDRKCGLGYHKQPKQESSLISQRALPSQQDKQPVILPLLNSDYITVFRLSK